VTVQARYQDGTGFMETVGSSNGFTVQPNTAKLAGMSYYWKSHVLLNSVGLQSSGPDGVHTMNTGSDGQYQLDLLRQNSYSLSASRSTTDSGTAITSADALAALRIAVGLNPNPDPDGAGPLTPLKVSPYQMIAADVNGDGKVTSADALAILRMAVKSPAAPTQEWLFVSESKDLWDETAGASALTRTSATWDKSLSANLQQDSQLNLVAVLKGDVNGSWAAPAGSIDLDNVQPNYIQLLGAQTGQPTDVWGV
jgi:Dockerin type I domain